MNVQGWNPAMREHHWKTARILETARKQRWTISSFTEMQAFEFDDGAPTNYCIEKYILITAGQVGIVILPAVLMRRWGEDGRQVVAKSERMLATCFQSLGQRHWFGAVYAPTQEKKTERQEFVTKLSDLWEDMQ